MTRGSTARRTNLALVVVVTAVAGVAAAAAISRGGTSDEHSSATTTSLVVSGPATVDGSWFEPVTVDEIVDYPVESLTCPSLALQLTLDLCAVADGDAPYMVVGQEGYWSPDEPDLDGVVRVPFVLTVYVEADTDDGRVARPVLSAVVSLPYGPEYNELSVHRPLGDGLGGTIVLAWSARDTLQEPALDGVQVIALVDGTPAVVATEIGTEMRIGSSGNAVLLIAPYPGVDDGDPLVAPTVSVVTLRPDGDEWSRRLTVVGATAEIADFRPAERLNSYGFPRDR